MADLKIVKQKVPPAMMKAVVVNTKTVTAMDGIHSHISAPHHTKSSHANVFENPALRMESNKKKCKHTHSRHSGQLKLAND